MNEPNLETVISYFRSLQDSICEGIQQMDGKAIFTEETWERNEGGGGCSRIIAEGAVFEKGGVNFSLISENQLPTSATAHRPKLSGRRYTATGISCVFHPYNPFVPTSHANVRFFLTEEEGNAPVWWFGGGFDLTPYYGFTEDCQHWHTTAKAVCQPFGKEVYPKYKKWCDEYFYLKHRKEARGIGGIFFDDLNEWGFTSCFAFAQAVGEAYLKAYLPICAKRKDHPFQSSQRDFQSYRRGRYVEFNLIWDRGTLFGLQSGGRTESILMSMPPHARWIDQYCPAPGTGESRLYTDFLPIREWI